MMISFNHHWKSQSKIANQNFSNLKPNQVLYKKNVNDNSYKNIDILKQIDRQKNRYSNEFYYCDYYLGLKLAVFEKVTPVIKLVLNKKHTHKKTKTRK